MSSLEQFFEKISTSRDGIDHLRHFQAIDSGSFALLIIEGQAWVESNQEILADLHHLSLLKLFPSCFFVSKDFSEKEKTDIEEKISTQQGKATPIAFIKKNEDFLGALQKTYRQNRFFKILFIRCSELKNEKNKAVNRVFIQHHSDSWSQDSEDDINWISNFLQHTGEDTSVQVMLPGQILQELFTSKGSGTMISLGYSFETTEGRHAKTSLLKELIEKGFKRQLNHDYFEKLGQDWFVISEKNHHGAMIVIREKDFFYLDKIVVSPKFLGMGLGSILLEELCQQLMTLSEKNPRLIWRARHDNPYLPRYANTLRQMSASLPMLCGSYYDEQYVYHFVGLSTPLQTKALEYMKGKEDSFDPKFLKEIS